MFKIFKVGAIILVGFICPSTLVSVAQAGGVYDCHGEKVDASIKPKVSLYWHYGQNKGCVLSQKTWGPGVSPNSWVTEVKVDCSAAGGRGAVKSVVRDCKYRAKDIICKHTATHSFKCY